MTKRYLSDWMGDLVGKEPMWSDTMDRDTKKGDEIDIETGIKGDKVTLRITSNGGLVTTVTMAPEWGRQIGRQLIGQANLLKPEDEEEET
jgi:hypothetical protein